MNGISNSENKLIELYNIVPSSFWSVINFTPIAVYCYNYLEMNWMYVFLVISISPYLFPNSFFNVIKLGNTISPYNKIGIRLFRKYVQRGDLVNRLIRRKIPQYRVIYNNRSVKAHLNKIYFIEKFHYAAFVFFLLTAIYALTNNFISFAVIITINNIVFNVYPILLQQYNRLRLNSYMNEWR